MRFALVPKRLSNGTWVWLETYSRQDYLRFDREPQRKEPRFPAPPPATPLTPALNQKPASTPRRWRDVPQKVDLSDRLEMAFEPIIDVATEKIAGFHAVPITKDAEDRLDVIVSEDRVGLLEFGAWSVETACRLSATWPAGARISFDISRFMPMVGAIRERIEPVVTDLRFPPERFGLVVNEDAVAQASFDELKQLAELRQLGVAIALDCSTGNPAPSERIGQFRFDELKLRSDVAHETEVEAGDYSRWMKFAELTVALGTKITAVGVASEQEVSFVRDNGFTHAQGPHISAPVDARRALSMLIGDQTRRPHSYRPLREARAPLKRRVGVNHQGYCHEGEVHNLSTKGAMIDGLWNVPRGTRLALQFSDESWVWATVRWGQGDRTGVEFDHALDLARLSDGRDFAPVIGWREVTSQIKAG